MGERGSATARAAHSCGCSSVVSRDLTRSDVLGPRGAALNHLTRARRGPNQRYSAPIPRSLRSAHRVRRMDPLSARLTEYVGWILWGYSAPIPRSLRSAHRVRRMDPLRDKGSVVTHGSVERIRWILSAM